LERKYILLTVYCVMTIWIAGIALNTLLFCCKDKCPVNNLQQVGAPYCYPLCICPQCLIILSPGNASCSTNCTECYYTYPMIQADDPNWFASQFVNMDDYQQFPESEEFQDLITANDLDPTLIDDGGADKGADGEDSPFFADSDDTQAVDKADDAVGEEDEEGTQEEEESAAAPENDDEKEGAAEATTRPAKARQSSSKNKPSAAQAA